MAMPASGPPAPQPKAGVSVPPVVARRDAISADAAKTPALPAADALPPRRSVAAPRSSRPAPVAFDFREAEAAEPDAEDLVTPRSATSARHRNAGSVARAIAAVIDAVILLGLDAGVLYFTLRVCRLSFADITTLPLAPLIAFFLLVDGGYLVAFTAVGGQTIGKMATSLKVVSEDGERVAPGQAAVRALGYVASAIPAGLGFVPGLVGPTRRALHDRLANTRVVRI